MAYVDLATQSAGQTASAAGWANVVKANFASMGPHLIVRKTADESTTATTVQDDDQLVMTAAANEVWWVQYLLSIVTTSGNFKWDFTFPSGRVDSTLQGVSNNFGSSGTTSPTTTSTTADLYSSGGAGGLYMANVLFACGGTGGPLQLRWCSSAGGNTTVRANSTLWAVKLA